MKGPVANFGGCSGPTEDRTVLRDPFTLPQKWCLSQKTLGRYLLEGRTWRDSVGIRDPPTFLA